MKRLCLLVSLAICAFATLNSQEQKTTKSVNTSKSNFNEVKLNGLFLVLGAFEVTYERTINEESAFGANVFVAFDDDIGDLNYFVSPYYRFYFGKKYAAGFYVEGFGMLNSTESYEIDFTSDSFLERNDAKTDFALGIGTGCKWLTKRGFIAEIGFGVGRNLFSNNDLDFEIIGKGGIRLGYRF